MKKLVYLTSFLFMVSSCNISKATKELQTPEQNTDTVATELQPATNQTLPGETIADETKPSDDTDDKKMEAMGFIDAKTVAPDVVVSLQYADSANFTGVKLYLTLTKAYLHPLAAESLTKAQKELSEMKPGYRLKIYDAARPMSAQKRMFKVVQGTPMSPYVGNPNKGGGLHNYGMAVDATIVDENGNELDMGTKFDYFGKEANIDKEPELIQQGKLTPEQVNNRSLLRYVMTNAGFTTLNSEWWHFNRCSGAEARANYPLIDF